MIPFQFLGPYRIGDAIGCGGMGTVYRAVHEKTGQAVAVKLIAVHVADDPRFRRRFADEVETLKRLKHRNIVTLIGYGEQSGHLFYSMELVQGESLQQTLRREKRLAWPLVLDMAIDICAALKHAHDFGVIHRDLKPANLLIDERGFVKLVDFGIAKLFGNHEQTAIGSVLGTADFMAPEQAGEGAITPRTDLYSLGNVLYACFAGRPPFTGRTLTRVMESLRQEAPARIDLIAPELPQEIAELIHDLLEKRPEDRPPTALAVMNRMKAIRAGLHHMATRLHDDADTVGAAPPAAPVHASDLGTDHPTAASAGDSKTLGQFDDGEITAPSPQGASDQLTIEATLPSELVSAAARQEQAAAETESDSPTTRTHFRTVQEQDRHRSVWAHERQGDHAPGRFWHTLSITAMVVALLLGLGVFLWSIQRPGADDLYQSIIQARESDDDEAFHVHADRFKRLYPQDPRTAELTDALEDLDAHRAVVGRLRVAAARKGGTEQLAPEEEAFLDAMKDRTWDPLRTQTRLQHWLDVYAPAGESVDGPINAVPRQMMIRAAQVELDRLESRQLPLRDQRAEELLERIQWGRENLSVQDQQKLLQGILSLFADRPWAQPVIDEAQRSLKEIER